VQLSVTLSPFFLSLATHTNPMTPNLSAPRISAFGLCLKRPRCASIPPSFSSTSLHFLLLVPRSIRSSTTHRSTPKCRRVSYDHCREPLFLSHLSSKNGFLTDPEIDGGEQVSLTGVLMLQAAQGYADRSTSVDKVMPVTGPVPASPTKRSPEKGL